MASLTLQSSFTGGELSPSLTARVDMAKYSQGCKRLRNFKVQPHGGAVKRPGLLLLDSLPGEAALIEFAFNSEQAYCLAFGEKWLRVFTPAGPVLDSSGGVYQVSTPYTLAQAKKISVAQSADVLFIACSGLVPYKLQRFAHNDWRFAAMAFSAPISAPSGVYAGFVNEAKKSDGTVSEAQLTTNYSYYVTALNADGKESELSPAGNITGPASNNWQAGDYITVSWPSVSGATDYNIYKSSFGSTPGLLSSSTSRSYNDYNASPAFDTGAPKYENPFPNNDYPAIVAFFEQRLVFASTPNRPQTIWMSASGDYDNFAIYDPTTDSSPIDMTIAGSEITPLCWMVSLRSLVAGSRSMEWEFSAASGSFTATSKRAVPQSYIGSLALPALVIGNTILHVARSGAQVRDLKYNFGADSYGGNDCSVLATHLFSKYKVLRWTYQQYPDSLVWIVRGDGVLLGMTYMPEQEVIAWHQHKTQGAVKDVCSIPNGEEDVLFVEVERNGNIFIERLAEEYTGGDYSRAVFLDCALVYDQPGQKISRVAGLEHLEGMDVGVLSGGAVQPPAKVQGGAVDLKWPSDLVIVGLEYQADLETMPLEFINQSGSTVGRKKHINEVNVLFHESAGGVKAGQSFNELETLKWRTDEPYGRAPGQFSGIRSAVIPALAESQATVCIRSDEPTPLTVLAIMAKMEVK